MKRALLFATALLALPCAADAARRNGFNAGSRTPSFLLGARSVPTLTLQARPSGATRNARFSSARPLAGAQPLAQKNARFATRNAQLQAQREPTPDEIWWGQAASGKIPWTQFVENLETLGKARPFESQAFVQQPQRYTFLAHDSGHQRPKFVAVRDLFARGVLDTGEVMRDDKTGDPVIDRATGRPLTIKRAIELRGGDPRSYDHAVMVATPNQRQHKQPVWLHQVDAQSGAVHLGRMLREALGVLPSTHQLRWATEAYVNMPGMISVPRLHAHGVWRSNKAPKISDWDAFLKTNRYERVADQGDFVVYKAPRNAQGAAAQLPLLAVAKDAKLATASLGASTDQLLGQMYLGLAGAALQNPRAFGGALQRGKIAIDSTDNRLVVRVFQRPAKELDE